jgi:hypothetical protein
MQFLKRLGYKPPAKGVRVLDLALDDHSAFLLQKLGDVWVRFLRGVLKIRYF